MTGISLATRISACTLCAPHLPLGPRPVVRFSRSARLLIIGQAPGSRVHETGIPWNDKSGDRLRQWLALNKKEFYDSQKIAIMPMGFCYPGTNKTGGDLPPRPECAPHWHEPILAEMPSIGLTLLVGAYAQKYYLEKSRASNLTQTVRQHEEYLPRFLPLPHPSWRTIGWQKKNPWFDEDLLPGLRQRLSALLT